MAVEISVTGVLSPPVTGSQYWALVASDGDRVVAIRYTGGTRNERIATFTSADPFNWTERVTPTAFSPEFMVVAGDTILAATDLDGSSYRYSLDAGATWSAVVFLAAGTGSILLNGTTVVIAHTDGSISTADLANLSIWTNQATNLPSTLINTDSLVFFDGAYYLNGGEFTGSIFESRVYKSTNLTNWELVYSSTQLYWSPAVLAMDARVIVPRADSIGRMVDVVGSADGSTWDVTPLVFGLPIGHGAVADNNVAVLIAGSGFIGSADGLSWDLIGTPFAPAGRVVRYDGGILAGPQVAGVQTMGVFTFTVPPALGWWHNLVNSTQEALDG